METVETSGCGREVSVVEVGITETGTFGVGFGGVCFGDGGGVGIL